ncbi:TPA: DNA methyltransferase [Caudoviricetes sp. vir323]|uniref:Cytosine-specific methyltransferase n=1 Tax=Caudoviricetes sp. vir323 TaxID=3068356 RepID=A0AA86XMI3_9CAUD|nr:TPA_asm: DNA methyltransferase [Caudoviricetes sp. vir323]
MEKFKFIDLFSGIGGFHQAMEQLGGECVLASEIDKYAVETYKENYNMDSHIDIRDLKVDDVPEHDVLCAGFPCQAFSKAGKQEGFDDETRGTLFFEIERIIKHHHPPYIVLENVRNLASHDKGRTWKTIEEHLHKAGYRLTPKPLIVSPHYFGTPQLRERVVILGIYDPEHAYVPLEINLGEFKKKNDNSIYKVLDTENVDEKYNISEDEEKVLTMWDEFYQGVDLDVIGFPVWFEWFKKEAPDEFKPWKKEFIRKNNELYQRNKEFIDSWIEKWDNLEWCTPTQRKFEWQAGKNINSIWEGLIQIRPSGVRVKVPTCFPALVAIVQIPIIGKYKRRLTVREAARLQDFPEKFIPNDNDQQAYKQFGNAVNVEVVKRCAEKLFDYDDTKVNEDNGGEYQSKLI